MTGKVKKWIAGVLAGLIVFGAVGCASNDSKQKETLTISAAASLKNVMDELTPVFEGENPTISLTFNYGSSGDLQKQIENGAPADIFISAAQKQMDALEKGGFIDTASRKDLLKNELVLIVPKGEKKITSLEDLVNENVEQVALGEPTAVPAGQYAEEALTTLGILDAVKAKAVYGKDVTQVLTYVENGEVSAGLVYKTDAVSSEQVDIVTSAPKGSYKEVVYPMAMVKESAHRDAAKTFMTFLQRNDVKDVFEKYGFSTT